MRGVLWLSWLLWSVNLRRCRVRWRRRDGGNRADLLARTVLESILIAPRPTQYPAYARLALYLSCYPWKQGQRARQRRGAGSRGAGENGHPPPVTPGSPNARNSIARSVELRFSPTRQTGKVPTLLGEEVVRVPTCGHPPPPLSDPEVPPPPLSDRESPPPPTREING